MWKIALKLCAVKPLVGTTNIGGIYEKGNNIHKKSLNAPSHIRAKWCGKELKGGKEKGTKAENYKSWHYTGWGKIGQSNDKRNCSTHDNQQFINLLFIIFMRLE